MITQVQQDMEDALYELLKKGGVGKKTIEKYPRQPIEELASVLTEGMMKSYVGDIIQLLDYEVTADFIGICKAAFRDAMLRLLREAKAESEVT